MYSDKAFTGRQASTIIGALFLVIIVGFVWNVSHPNFDLIAYIGGMSTLAVALLTVAYVFTTSRQLSVMQGQLDEMRKSREYQSQPLPVISITGVFIERPRCFYTPPSKEYSAQSRHIVEFRVQNEGTHPAVNVIVSAWIGIPSGGEGETFGASSILIEVIPEGRSYPPTDNLSSSFLFSGDHSGQLIASLRDKDINAPPLVQVRCAFRNALGACYVSSSLFHLYMKNTDDEETLKNWHAAIASYRIRYKNELEKLESIRRTNSDEWDRLFEKMRSEFEQQVGGTERLEIAWFPTPLSYSIEPFSEDEYTKLSSGVGFGFPIPSWFDGCHDPETA